MLEQSFTPKEYPKPQFEYPDALLPLHTTITIRIHTSVMDKVLEYCTYDHFQPDGPVHYLVAFPFMENDYYYQILFSFGAECECLEPLHIRSEMKRRIEALAALYQASIPATGTYLCFRSCIRNIITFSFLTQERLASIIYT